MIMYIYLYTYIYITRVEIFDVYADTETDGKNDKRRHCMDTQIYRKIDRQIDR